MPRVSGVSGVSRAPDFPSALGFLPRRPEFQHDDLGLCQGRRLETLSAAFYPNATVEHHPWPPLPYCTPEFVPERQSLATRIGTHFETHVADVACHVWFVECLEWVGWHRLWHELESLWGRCLARGFGHTGSDAEAKLRAEHRRSFQFGENHPKCKMSARPARHRCDFSELSKLWSVQSIESKFCVGQGVKFSCRRHTNRCAINTPRPPQKHLQQSNCCASSDSRPTSFWKTKKHCDKLANCACCSGFRSGKRRRFGWFGRRVAGSVPRSCCDARDARLENTSDSYVCYVRDVRDVRNGHSRWNPWTRSSLHARGEVLPKAQLWPDGHIKQTSNKRNISQHVYDYCILLYDVR